MKPNGKAEAQALAPQGPKPDAAVVPLNEGREQVFGDLLDKACELIGTHSTDVADRLIVQLANAQVPKTSKQSEDCLITAPVGLLSLSASFFCRGYLRLTAA